MSSTHKTSQEYKSRINKTLDYIEANLDKQFTLDELALAASFSKYHFHRIFIGLMNETPFQFITRLRLQRAATFLVMNPNISINEIAHQCGFTDVSIFSRNFKQHFGQSPTVWLKQMRQKSNLSQIDSNPEKVKEEISVYFCSYTKTLKWNTSMKLNKGIEIKELPDMTVAYVRHIGPYKGNEELFRGLWQKIMTWAGPRGLMAQPNLSSLAVYHDDPNITDDMKLRTSIGITVPDDTGVDGEVGKMLVQGGQYVVAKFEVEAHQFAEAWNWVYASWFPESGYQPDDKPCFEMYTEEPKDGKFVVDICVPVKAL
ncbi:MAG: AraC family transcriptional regulator [Bacteroidales bacterium]|nr:AraC family transcriptional regulator [Bacteroidales bacterium]